MKKVSASTKKATASLYRDAARLVETGEETYSCIAIYRVTDSDDKAGLVRRYRAVFDRKNHLQTAIYAACDNDIHSPKCVDFRVMLLCFAAAMAETGDL